MMVQGSESFSMFVFACIGKYQIFLLSILTFCIEIEIINE